MMIMPVSGIPPVSMNDDIAAVIAGPLNSLVWPDGGRSLWGDDIVVIAGKIVAKAQGRYTKREADMADEFDALDAKNLLMFRAIPRGLALYRPENCDEAAAQIRQGLAARFGGRPGVIISGSERERRRGRGRRDIALGSAGIDLATERGEAVVDALAAAAGVVINTNDECPVAVIRGVGMLHWED
ncbi:coenzyme F420-0:L-glutamate ligase [Arcanobacterium haemolyticum]|nr:coenzyme F420-0:L-glutamate ligase [Arcanobacterium haemolyticum]